MALRMVATVVAYQLFHLTKSSFSIGIVGLSEFLPVFSLALYAGHVIDRSDKRDGTKNATGERGKDLHAIQAKSSAGA